MKKASLLTVVLLFIGVSFTAITILPDRVEAATLYVGGAGPGNYTTIQSAIDDATIGDTVYVYGGTYYENVIVNRTLSLIGESKDATVIDGGGSGDVVHISADWVNITHFAVLNSGSAWNDSGIELDSVVDCHIGNNAVLENAAGISLDSSSHNAISNNSVSANAEGISLYWSSNNSVINNVAYENGDGIHLADSDANVIAENSAVSNLNNGIYMWGSHQNEVVGNNASSNTHIGMNLWHSNDNAILENIVSDNLADNGVFLYHSANNTIVNNTIFKHYFRYGMYLEDSTYNSIVDNNISHNAGGIFLWSSSDNNTIADNSFSWNLGYVVRLHSSNTNDITRNILSNNSGAFHLESSSQNTIADNNDYSDSETSISLSSSNSNIITGNREFSNAGTRIITSLSSSNVIMNNSLVSPYYAVIILIASKSSIMVNNTMEGSENGISIQGDLKEHWDTHTIESSNTVEGRPVYYLSHVVGGEVPPGAGQVILANCTGVKVESQDISHTHNGIGLGFSSGNIVDGNTVEDNRDGISLHSSENNTIVNNTVSVNYNGIRLMYSGSNTMINNTVSENQMGLLLEDSFDNEAYHNNFIENSFQAFSNQDAKWDDGYPSGGNFWSDYNGTDLFSGQGQDQPGSDGIGDTPYAIPVGEDRYPLILPVGIPSAPRDLRAVGGNQEVTLTWMEPVSDGGFPIMGYAIYRGNFSGQETLLVETGNVLTHQDTGLTNGQVYYYRISARNSRGNGPPSSRANATPINQLPICAIITPVSGATISGTYTVVGNASDSDGIVERVEIRIDAGSWIGVNGTTSWIYDWDTTTVPNGNHTIYARSFDGTDYSEEMSVTAVVDNAVTPPPPSKESIFEQAWFWIAVIIMTVIILLAILILVRRRKENQEEGESLESG